MSKTIPWMILIGMTTVLLSISFCQPHLLDDRNNFLREFVGADLLATLGFIMTVTLASAGSLHLELNKLEEETGRAFTLTRGSIRKSVTSLMALFAFAISLVVLKPLLPAEGWSRALANSAAILVLFFNLSVLHDLSRTVFRIPTASKLKARKDDDAT